jgi:hypothetical protein
MLGCTDDAEGLASKSCAADGKHQLEGTLMAHWHPILFVPKDTKGLCLFWRPTGPAMVHTVLMPPFPGRATMKQARVNATSQ